MEPCVERTDSPALSGDYYYLKALSYLAMAADTGSASSTDDEQGSCTCPHCPSSRAARMEGEEEEDVHFSMAFRPGLILDDLHPCSASGGSDAGSPSSATFGDKHQDISTSGSKAVTASSHKSERESGEVRNRKLRVKRKLSDGHVHWADEFQKDLTRCHPRKAYSRHPSHHPSHVKPILKANSEDGDMS